VGFKEIRSKKSQFSFRGDAQHRTRNLEIPGLVLGAKLNINFVASDHPGMTVQLHSEPVAAGTAV
jgi:hypothetical protein